MASLLAELKGRRIFAINRPGGGLSEGMDYTTVDIRKFAVATLAAVIDAFKLTNVDIVAHSIGGHWSLWLAMDRPELVRSLTLLGNPGNVMKGKLPPVMRLLIRWPFNRVLARIVKGSDTNKKPTLLKLMGSSKETINSLPAVLGAAYFYFRRLPHYLISLISLLQNAAPKIDARQLCQVKQPARLLLGDKDTFATVATGESIAAAMPNCRLCVINDAGHLPWLEQPVECGNLIKDFFKML
jgi:pimeloyl-ACP methyl ester carboxylesterase